MGKVYLWNQWNVRHVAKHHVSPGEVEYVVDHAARPYPQKAGNEKWLVRGRTAGGRALQVVYLVLPTDEVDVRYLDLAERVGVEQGEDVLYVIHSRELTRGEIRRL